MQSNGVFRLLTGWSDFFYTVAETVLPRVGLYSLAEWLAERHYAGVGSFHRAGAKELILADIAGRAGDVARAESSYKRAIALRPNEPDPYAFWGTMYEQRGQRAQAMWAYERALPLAHEEPAFVAELGRRLSRLDAESESGSPPNAMDS
jgi:tetratricopeptide (TPR) repeat protein